MPVSPAIPTNDASFDAYLYNWKTLLTATPATWGMTAGDATAITNLYTPWHTAYVANSDPATKTATTVAEKNYRKALALILLRQQYQIIKTNPGVSDTDKTAIGVRVNDPVPTPIPPPTTTPIVVLRNAAPLTMSIDWTDSDSPTSRRKPPGATGCVVMRAIGIAPATDPSQCQFEGVFSRVPALLAAAAPGDAGKYYTVFARWVNAKGDEGPWSSAVSQIITN